MDSSKIVSICGIKWNAQNSQIITLYQVVFMVCASNSATAVCQCCQECAKIPRYIITTSNRNIYAPLLICYSAIFSHTQQRCSIVYSDTSILSSARNHYLFARINHSFLTKFASREISRPGGKKRGRSHRVIHNYCRNEPCLL